MVCHTKSAEHLIAKFKPLHEQEILFKKQVETLLFNSKDISNPYVAMLINRLAKKSLNSDSLYAKEKWEVNELLMGLYGEWSQRINSADNSLNVAAKLAVIGNIIDYGAHSVPKDIIAAVKELLNQKFVIDDRLRLFQKVKNAKSVLYLGDNAGEIVFDRLLIEKWNHPNLTYVVRGSSVLNDVTIEDTNQVNMRAVCKIITNGHDAPSTLIDNCSSEFQDLYNNADVVISKGQGNFEGLMSSSKENLFFMLMAKCDIIANMLNVAKGDMLVVENKNLKNGI